MPDRPPLYHRPRSVGYIARSSPLAGPAIAIYRASTNDDPHGDQEKDVDEVNSLKTRTGATPSRISAQYSSSSLRGVPVSCPPSPSFSRYASSLRGVPVSCPPSSSLSRYASSLRGVPVSSPPSRPPSRPSSVRSSVSFGTTPVLPSRQPQPQDKPKLAPQSPPSTPTLPPEKPGMSLEPSHNWLTLNAPPTFSRTHVKDVVMPVKAPVKRPHSVHGSLSASVAGGATPPAPVLGKGAQNDTFHSSDGLKKYASTEYIYPGVTAGVTMVSYADGKRQTRISMSSLRLRLWGGRKRRERDGDNELGKSSSKLEDTRAVAEALALPALSIRTDEDTDDDDAGRIAVDVPEDAEKAASRIRRWERFLKMFARTGRSRV